MPDVLAITSLSFTAEALKSVEIITNNYCF